MIKIASFINCAVVNRENGPFLDGMAEEVKGFCSRFTPPGLEMIGDCQSDGLHRTPVFAE